jgi:N-acetylneuraminic acid mutarotase
MIIWGGQASNSGNLTLSNSGARYRPDRDEWQPMLGSIGRIGHIAVWTGTEVIIWGGSQSTALTARIGLLHSGARFNPVTRAWTPISMDGAPSARQNHEAVWTGTEMIVWGGEGYSTNGPYGQSSYGALNSGGRYNPASDTWTPMETDVVPIARSGHSMVWTGSEVLMFGGRTIYNENQNSYLDSGASYNPVTDSWEALSHFQAPSPRFLHTDLWTGKEMIIWGGLVSTNQTTLLSAVNTGASYNPVLDRWTPLATNGAPRTTAARLSAAVWTGDNMIVVAGNGASSPGALYNPASNRWSPISGTGAPTTGQPATSFSVPSVTLVWTGKEVLVWGTMTPTNGTRYNPLTDTWTTMTTTSAPKARSGHTAVWTGDSMVVVGGLETGANLPDTTLVYQLTRPLYLYGKR